MTSVQCLVCGLQSVDCCAHSVHCIQCNGWRVKRSVECGVLDVKCREWSVKCRVWSVKRSVVSSVKSRVWSVKCSVELD